MQHTSLFWWWIAVIGRLVCHDYLVFVSSSAQKHMFSCSSPLTFFYLSFEYLSCNSCSTITRFPRYNDPLKVFLLKPTDMFIFHNLLPCCLILLSPLSPWSLWKLEGVAVGNGPIALLFIVVLLAMNLVW